MLINLDEVATGALVNAIALVGRRFSLAVESRRGRKRTDDLHTARWFQTYRLTSHIPELPMTAPGSAERLAATLRGDEVQAALQELLATRLTDAPETEASRARQVLHLTLVSGDPDAASFARMLVDYYDDQISALVARLEADDRKPLEQIRLEAFATRLVGIVGAIERHAAALAARPAQRTEASFLASYRRHVIDQHGKLEPPDFDRRRRVPIRDIYVPTIITKVITSELSFGSRSIGAPLDVWKLAAELDRSVLLGDPGAGKTTASNVLMHHFAGSGDRPVPFLVTLRHYAAKDPPEHSVVEHIEHTLNTLYQTPPPHGMIDLLLLTGRAAVIFDGLDELLDTYRRADVTTRVERFCAEYPLAPVLVTSRVIGYEQAMLDSRHFAAYMLGGFADEQVAEYARKWFAQDSDARAGDADAFLLESVAVSDLRSNPLMLALLCILYRGAGSLPRNRAEVYEQCASLLFHKWDARRKIHQELRAGHLLEPALRHLAWWLFSRDSAETAVTERDLITETGTFLLGRGFEFDFDAHAAAREFVEFCRGRMWVFTDAGTTATGEKLFAFTHRTFLEYFAAAELAYRSDTPEQLAKLLAVNISFRGLSLVGELAIQIKDHTSNIGARRIYAVMMADSHYQPAYLRCYLLQFLTVCMRSVDPSPQRVRELTRRLVREAISGLEPTDSWRDAVRALIVNCGSYRETVADEIAAVVTETVHSGDGRLALRGLLLAASLPDGAAPAGQDAAIRWEPQAANILGPHAATVAAAAQHNLYLRRAALAHGFISAKQALEMPHGLASLFEEHTGFFPHEVRSEPYIGSVLRDLGTNWPLHPNPTVIEDLAAIGEYLRGKPELPWVDRPSPSLVMNVQKADPTQTGPASPLIKQAAWLGAIAVITIAAEGREDGYRWTRIQFGPLPQLYPYLTRRHNPYSKAELPDLPVPGEFKTIFHAWARCQVNLTSLE